MKILFPINREQFFGVFAQAFCAPSDRPLRGGKGRVRGDIWAALGVLALSAFFYFLMNLPFRPRFHPEPFAPAAGTFVSLGGNLCFSLLLRIPPGTRSLAFIPLIFCLFPLSYLILSLTGGALRGLIPATAEAGGLDWKFVYDCLFFLAELALAVPLLIFSRTGNPLSLKRRPPRSMGNFVRFWEIFFLLGVLGLWGLLLWKHRDRFPPGRILALLKYQIPFALLLGFKEELIFRWLLLRKAEEALGSRITAVCSAALIWSLYHGFFGEGLGAGFWPAFWVCVVSFWWSLLSYRYGSLWRAWAGHTAVELYGFYLLYIPFMG